MNYKKIISLTLMSFIGEALGACKHATKLGYSCCKGCTIALKDDSGKWGIENNKWCGIDSSKCGAPVSNASKSKSSTCWAKAEGYNCCKAGAKVVVTDSKGKWGVENGQWCGIITSKTKNSSCWAASQGYKCCSGCNPIYVEGSQKWGVENGQWCGIINSKCSSKPKATTKARVTTKAKVTTRVKVTTKAKSNTKTKSSGGTTSGGSTSGGSTSGPSQKAPGWTPGNDKVLPGFLSTSGKYIVDQRGRKVKLAGISWFGGETDNLSPHGLWSKSLDHFINTVKKLGYNHIRYPWTNSMLVSGAKTKSINDMENPNLVNLTPLEVMDAVINACGKVGLKVYLDRHRPTSDGQSELWYVSGVDEAKWIEDWQFLAKRYKGNPTVIGADIHNEPHGTACWGCGETKRDWRLAAERCGNAIHKVNPDWLIIVEGNDHYGEEGWQKGESYWWGGMLKGVKENPVRLNRKNKLVYSAHDYDKNVNMQEWFKESNFPDNMPKIWDDKWGFIAKQNIAPVLISEFGSLLKDSTDVKWLQNLVSYMKKNDVHWTFWCLNPNSGDTEGILNYDWETVNTKKDNILKPGKAPNFLLN